MKKAVEVRSQAAAEFERPGEIETTSAGAAFAAYDQPVDPIEVKR